MTNNYMGTKAGLNNIKAVMGWDIGDGDSVAFIKPIVGGRQFAEPLYIHKVRSQQVEKSVVSKTSAGKITIGIDAAQQQEFAINFKCAPKNWNHKYVMGLTYRQHMLNYIRGVSEAILQNSSNVDMLKKIDIITEDGHWKKDEVLLVVGCPASVIWKEEKMRKQYEELISEATDISNVIVTEESRAAVFSLFDIGNIRKEINLQTGVLVLDFGSSTADATYILPGKKAVNLSWELGAAQVENAMLEYILQSSKAKKGLANLEKTYDKKRVLVVRNNCSHAVFQLRLEKENYFDGKLGENAVAKAVSIPIMDEDGDQIFDDVDEEVELALRFRVTDEMMQYALDEYEFEAKKNDQIVNRGTWKENCWQFLNDVKQTLERKKLQVTTVVVTGGGSQMPFTVELSSKAFPGKVKCSDTPSHSVVKGLVTVAYNAVKAPEVYKEAINNIKSDAAKNISIMLESIADNLADKAYDAAVNAVNSLAYGSRFSTNMGEITRTAENAVRNSLEENVKPQINDSQITWKDNDNKVIVQRINESSQQLYADRAMREMIRISQADVNTISNNLFLPNIGKNIVPNLLGNIVEAILWAVIWCLVTVLALIVPGLGLVFGGIVWLSGKALIDVLKKHEGLPVLRVALRKTVIQMQENKNEKMKEIKEPINQALQEAFTKPDAYGKDFEKHDMVLTETAKMAFNKILLKAEDEQEESEVVIRKHKGFAAKLRRIFSRP